jgi:signal transduction histidine kinase
MRVVWKRASEDQVPINATHPSSAETLVEFCREILFELFGTEWVLVGSLSGCPASADDLCIWDFAHAETAVPQGLEAPKTPRDWFVVHRNDLRALQEVVGNTDLRGLLRPVTRGALGALFGGASPQQDKQNDGSPGLIGALRVQCDDLLQLLVQANHRLQENDQERNNFLARSVHDFRAPLTAISGYCGLLLEEEFGPLTPEQQRVLGRMLHGTTRLSRVSSGMFQLSARRNVDQGLNLEKADIRDCLDQALHEVAPILEDKRISIAAEFDPAPDGLLFEKKQIEQTFAYLLDNACKYAPRDGTIEIRGYPFFWERRAGPAESLGRALERRVNRIRVFNSFRVDIRDSGPGIPAVQVDRIFDEFTSSGGRDRSGGGLGLAICRMILERHQGRIWAESNPSGTAFSFVLPLQQTAILHSCVGNSPEDTRLTEAQEI